MLVPSNICITCNICREKGDVLPVQVKNLDSPTLSSTLFNDMDTCRTAVEERERERERERTKEKEKEKERENI